MLVEDGGFLYDSDAYNDDLPYFLNILGKPHLILPYTPDVNDFRFWSTPGLTTAADFLTYMKDSFDVLYEEAESHPKMMSIGLHMRIIGRPGRISALRDFLAYAQAHGDVWFATREEIAKCWLGQHK